MEIWLIAFVLCVILLAATAHTVTGFGFSLVAAPLLVLAIPVREAVVVISLLALVNSLLIVRGTWRDVTWPTVRTLLIGAAAGMPLGLVALLAASGDVLRLCVGVVAIVMAAAIAAGLQVRTQSVQGELLAGVTSGLLATSTSLNGPPVVLYLQARRLPPTAFRGALSVFFLASNAAALTAFAAGGVLSARAFGLALAGLPGVLLATAVGGALLGRIDQQLFRWLVLALLTVTALVAIATSIASLAA